MTATNDSVSERLADFIAGVRWRDIPAPLRHEAQRALMNYFACALGGCRDAAVEFTAAVLSKFSGAARATVIGRGETTDALTAAFLNAASANVFDFDDTHTRTVIHPTAPVAAALFAYAEAHRTSGEDLLLAFVLGVEVECRIGNAVSPGHYRRGWHITSTCGGFGAAAAIGKLLGLSGERLNWALGLASAQAGGLLETLGTMAKSVSVGNAARNGLAAALYAQAGVTAPSQPLEGTYGFLRVTGDTADAAAITQGLGKSWELSLNTYKPYPCGVVVSPVIDACLALRSEAIATDDIASIEITGHPLLRERTGRTHPASGREAQVSAQHCVAVALTRGRATLDEFTDACAVDPSLRPLREKVKLIDDAQRSVECVTVTVHLKNGATFTRTVDRPRGSVASPLTDADLEEKLRDLAAFGCSDCDPAPLIYAVRSLPTAEDAASVMRLAAAGRA